LKIDRHRRDSQAFGLRVDPLLDGEDRERLTTTRGRGTVRTTVIVSALRRLTENLTMNGRRACECRVHETRRKQHGRAKKSENPPTPHAVSVRT
jgi:hypothetical protein